jgi:hypothetical protein
VDRRQATDAGGGANTGTEELFRRPFLTGWVFDVELIARLIQRGRAGAGPPPERAIIEVPLHKWRDVEGSKVRWHDFFRALRDLATIYFAYLKPPAPA